MSEEKVNPPQLLGPELRIVYLAPVNTTAIGGVSRFDTELRCAMSRIGQLSVLPVLAHEASRLRRAGGVGLPVATFLKVTEAKRRLRQMEERDEVDVVFHSFHWPPRISKKIPSIGFVHDLRMIGAHERRRIQSSSLQGRMIKRAIDSWDVVCVPSEHVADDVSFLLPWVVPEVTGEGLDHLPVTHDSPRNRILIISGTAEHKRPELAKEVAVRIHDRYQLPVTVHGVDSGPWAVHRDITALNQISDHHLARVLSESLICVATSSYEGFGLSVGEAMRAGCPVVFGTDAHLEQLVQDAGVMVEPSPREFELAIEEILRNHHHFQQRALLNSSAFLWLKAAEKILFGRTMDEAKSTASPPRVREHKLPANQLLAQKPFWSVVIPTYNRAKELCRAIDSVLAQTDSDFEILIVDDGSDDETVSILSPYLDPRIRVLSHDVNAGASVARNTAIRHSHGSYVCFLDSDDYWLREKLWTVRRAIDASVAKGKEVGILIHATKVVDELGDRLSEVDTEESVDLKTRLLRGELIQTSALVVRRDLALSVHFDRTLPVYEDWEFLMACERALQGLGIVVLSEGLSVHDARRREGRLSNHKLARQAGKRLLRLNLFYWTRSDRAAFMLLRQLFSERALRSRLDRISEVAKNLKLVDQRTSKHLVAAANVLFPGLVLTMKRSQSRKLDQGQKGRSDEERQLLPAADQL